MAGMLISNFMMFFPGTTQVFCAIGLAVFFFAIYIPYNEYKQKKKRVGRTPPKPPKQKPVRRPVDQKQARQWEVLKEAGLLTEEEYRERLRDQ